MERKLSLVIIFCVLVCFVSSASAFDKYQSRTRGNQASFNIWTDTSCGYEGLSVWIFEENQRGKQTSYNTVYIDFYGYDFCNGTYKGGYGMVDGASFNIQNLKSASLKANGSLEIYSCNYGIPSDGGKDEDSDFDAGIGGAGGSGDDGGMPEDPCTYSSAPFSVDIEWIGAGDIYRDRSSSSYSTPYSRYRSSYSGQTCDATVSGTFLINGDAISIADGYGSLSKSSSGYFEVYW